MSAEDTVRRNKTAIVQNLCGDYMLILNKVHQNELITQREYRNLKSIDKEDVEGHVVRLVDKLMNKGEDSCKAFLNLLQTDAEIVATYPKLKSMQLKDTSILTKPVQACSGDVSESKRPKEEKLYELNSKPTGLCVIINNENFNYRKEKKKRSGTNKDADLAEVFSRLGFRALMCKDQTKDQMERALKCFASQSDLAQLREFNVEEWSGSGFTPLQEAPRHGDAFVCCILSHGGKGVVFGVDDQPLSIKTITGTFKTAQSTLTGKPKVFLIQACQGGQTQRRVSLEADDSPSPSTPEDADFLVAIASVGDFQSYRHSINGSWFVQSLCQQLKEGCKRSEHILNILVDVNYEVAQKEGYVEDESEGDVKYKLVKQMPEVTYTLTKRLVLSPHRN
ncbi:caspase-8-like isoform X2 [Anarrhichthys ocellatus]|uniref:caspase-8-like isoform X2 n=1 Tax=Anarrhichthys ocellatus TaxID=433405 RepID=UPI0012EE851B|nr:caspase-8-like isoform X2 [Anarrhichthys ocellatus]